jgi:hypothetical protein
MPEMRFIGVRPHIRLGPVLGSSRSFAGRDDQGNERWRVNKKTEAGDHPLNAHRRLILGSYMPA